MSKIKIEEWRATAADHEELLREEYGDPEHWPRHFKIVDALREASVKVAILQECLLQVQNAAIDLAAKNKALEARAIAGSDLAAAVGVYFDLRGAKGQLGSPAVAYSCRDKVLETLEAWCIAALDKS
jgi:hypothetical protein